MRSEPHGSYMYALNHGEGGREGGRGEEGRRRMGRGEEIEEEEEKSRAEA